MMANMAERLDQVVKELEKAKRVHAQMQLAMQEGPEQLGQIEQAFSKLSDLFNNMNDK